MFYDNRHSPEVQEWCYRIMNDPEYFEKFRYIDTINDYNMIIEQFQKLYDKAPVTDHLLRAKILKQIACSRRALSKIQTEHEMFKKYKTSTAISK
jgi:hypothetical protein